ncbi:MAG TPA: ATP-binding cassette domain-containing protein [Spirochaetia bacterium]|nr:ATP-binding cassette domain-containing protein [Spirochaetia bacterium]
MKQEFCSISNLTFQYAAQSQPLFENLSLPLPAGWTGGMPDELYSLLAETASGERLLIERLGIGYDWPYRWETLSWGERKRAQLAAALYLRPDMLVLDEPTNHLDVEASAMVRSALLQYHGIGVVISHDRELLDLLCDRCLFLGGGTAVLRPCGVTRGTGEAEREAEAARQRRKNALDRLSALEHEASARRAVASRSDAMLSKRRLSPKDHDAKGKINLARVSGKDAVGGKLLRQMEERLAGARREIAESEAPPVSRLGITIDGRSAKRDFLYRTASRMLALGPDRRLFLPDIEVRPGDRIALLGPNGCGKSTLVRTIHRGLDAVSTLYLPQELSAETIDSLVERLASLDSMRRGEILSSVKRLGSDPEQLLSSSRPSPGEARKLFIALALSSDVEIIILDEPSNHMDLPSIQSVEEALTACTASLLVVTHDESLARSVAQRRWVIARDPLDGGSLRLTQEYGTGGS